MKMKITVQEQTFEVEIGDIHARPIQASVDGQVFEVWPEETAGARPAAVPVSAAPSPSAAPAAPAPRSAGSNAVLAPIPGVITEIKAAAGDKVSYRQELCVLEAMKMKNSIRAGHDGTIARVLVSTGDQVQQGKVLMEFQDEAG
ncbi:MAG: glutaconyl-CoA/methylmalonyl-CoA decarboxylase subunit gamma [Chloroflexota bacterium]|nr:glutaconyl-CoA/methylmalonyl-CoA decarboxylase subunit gamma [Chloroflexota bacterium]